jgi:hypothetical protein
MEMEMEAERERSTTPTTKEVKKARSERFKDAMEAAGKTTRDLLDDMGLEGQERRRVEDIIANIRSGFRNLSPELAKLFVPYLRGVDAETLFGELTDRERKLSSTVESKRERKKAPLAPGQTMLDGVMTERRISANALAGLLEQNTSKRSELAVQLASCRAGEETLPDGIRRNIERMLELRDGYLSREEEGEEAPARTLAPKKGKKFTRRVERKVEKTTEQRPTPEVPTGVHSGTRQLEVTPVEVQTLDNTVQLPATLTPTKGGFLLRISGEMQLTKEQLLDLLLSRSTT